MDNRNTTITSYENLFKKKFPNVNPNYLHMMNFQNARDALHVSKEGIAISPMILDVGGGNKSFYVHFYDKAQEKIVTEEVRTEGELLEKCSMMIENGNLIHNRQACPPLFETYLECLSKTTGINLNPSAFYSTKIKKSAEEILGKTEMHPGSYLIRGSASEKNLVISYKDSSGTIRHDQLTIQNIQKLKAMNINLTPIIPIIKEEPQPEKISLPTQKILVLSTQTPEGENADFVKISSEIEQYKNSKRLNGIRAGHTGLAITKTMSNRAIFAVQRSEASRKKQFENPILLNALSGGQNTNKTLVITGHGEEGGVDVQGIYVTPAATQQAELTSALTGSGHAVRTPEDFVDSAMRAGLKTGESVTVLLNICYGASSLGRETSFAEKLARAFAEKGIEVTIFASNQPVGRFGLDKKVTSQLSNGENAIIYGDPDKNHGMQSGSIVAFHAEPGQTQIMRDDVKKPIVLSSHGVHHQAVSDLLIKIDAEIIVAQSDSSDEKLMKLCELRKKAEYANHIVKEENRNRTLTKLTNELSSILNPTPVRKSRDEESHQFNQFSQNSNNSSKSASIKQPISTPQNENILIKFIDNIKLQLNLVNYINYEKPGMAKGAELEKATKNTTMRDLANELNIIQNQTKISSESLTNDELKAKIVKINIQLKKLAETSDSTRDVKLFNKLKLSTKTATKARALFTEGEKIISEIEAKNPERSLRTPVNKF